MTEKIIGSMSEIEAASSAATEYATIPGFKPSEMLRIASLTAGDMIEWSEANEGEAKRTAGLRLICRSLVGPGPENLRYADDPKHIATFRRMPHRITENIVKEILKLNGMTVAGDTAAKKD